MILSLALLLNNNPRKVLQHLFPAALRRSAKRNEKPRRQMSAQRSKTK